MLDIDQLLVPISVTQVSGEDLSFSTEIDSIAHARRHDDPALDQSDWVETLKEADWPYVANHCERLIRSRSKDLRLAVWLAEAHAKTHHFRGLGDGYALLAGLCDRFWDSLYPCADGDDHEQRVGNLFWLLAREVCLDDYDAARQRASNPQGPDEWGKSPEPTGPTVEELDAQRRRNSGEFNAQLLADARYCLASLNAFEAAIDQRLGNAGPSFAAAREALQHAIDFIGLLAPEEAAQALPPGDAPAAKTQRHDGTIASRQQAIDQLRKIADYFRRTEPHSPVAYLADKAASWAGMPLHQWLQAVVKDQGQLAQLNELLGTVASDEGA
jgi:type VI secretion system protein ImpA